MTDVCCVRERLLGADAGRCRDPSGRGVKSCAETYTNRRGRGDLETPLAHYHTWLELAPLNHRDHRARGRAGDAHAGGRGDTFPLAKQHPRTTIVPRATLDAVTGCSAKSIVLLSPALWAGEQRRIIQPRCLAASAALRRQRRRARGSAPPPKVSRSGGRKPAASGASDGADAAAGAAPPNKSPSAPRVASRKPAAERMRD